MNMLPFHPAPSSVGELLPGQFSIPNNPISDAHSIAAANSVTYRARLAELMPARFSIPENPLLRELTGMSSLRGCRSCEVGFVRGVNGLNGFTDDIKAWYDKAVVSASDLFAGGDWTKWAMIGGGVLLLFSLMPGGSSYRGQMKSLRSKQREERKSLRRKYRGYRRAARAIAE